MKIPITKFGLPQVAFFSADLLGLMLLFAFTVKNVTLLWTLELISLAFLLWVLAFFRDPNRKIPQETDILLAPADGKISDIDLIDDPNCKGQKLMRVGIFLSVFNVHINRVPCRVKIDSIKYCPGQFKNAMSPESAQVNESNDLTMTRLDEPSHMIVVRQISGAIARRIVCIAKPDNELSQGQRFGMIKFGSRTEICIPEDIAAECLVKVGQKVKAGETILMKYKNEQTR
ncbi:MAG: phosphatidylserine decarboxylase [Anaerohalosphaeraceae bacterium]|nr:phosphatidylserine decarboxylase [Anaerohalosphaeraceae bacterium]